MKRVMKHSLAFVWLVRLVILAAVVWMLGTGTIGAFWKPGTPSKLDKAPWVMQTFSSDNMGTPCRVYFISDGGVEIGLDGKPIIDNYWRYDGKQYHHETEPKEITSPYTIERRKS